MTATARASAIVLAGGRGRRLGGILKAGLELGGVPMLTRVLGAIQPQVSPVVVVGPDDLGPLIPPDVLLTRESPPGGGPVAGIAAGLDRLVSAEPRQARVLIVAADLPLLTPEAVELLLTSTSASRPGAVFVDDAGQPQWLCGVWWESALRRTLEAIGDPSGLSMRQLVRDLDVTHVWFHGAPPPWIDCDTDDDIRRAEEWLHDSR
jgi:molybdopterin-guanine dinucleotide biosynthesis protein A